MKNIKSIIVLSMVAMVLFSTCQLKKEKITAQIKEAEKQLETDYSQGKMQQLVALYQEYAKTFPKDSTTAEYLFRSANMNMKLRKGNEALADLNIIISKYPSYSLLPECYFLKGFIYEDVLYDIENAKNAYYEFVAAFPSHGLAIQASMAIALLDKSEDEVNTMFRDPDIVVNELE